MLLRTILAALTATAALLVPATAAAAAPATDSTAAPGSATATDSTAASTGTAEALAVAADANPVIVVGGLIGISIAYEPIAARLRADGFRVSIYQLPGLGFGDIRESARALASYVDQIRAATGAAKVDLVTHSEGGLVSRWYVKFLGGTSKVDHYISLGSPQQGTYVANILQFVGLGSCAGIVACQQMSIGSDFLTGLNGGDDTPGAVRWTTVRTWQDELVRPVGNAALADGATNVLIQSWCPLRVVGHLGLVLDGTTYTVVRQALTDAAIRPNCFAL
ncbi:lipase [Micromonospora globispora]|uniref:Lipase n=1 Tax=Micromonospora globispora TaxID=1450148 RepID=A0A317KE26_9ACTN|nr:alpha/beta fold hydrolase [Micromonospora globispora]PWU51675.1 lipase [Micromonospora globispora]PWU58998.1 lipase [Micromonospora globispora]RQW86730.1 lipase [Micromonospora globispora]